MNLLSVFRKQKPCTCTVCTTYQLVHDPNIFLHDELLKFLCWWYRDGTPVAKAADSDDWNDEILTFISEEIDIYLNDTDPSPRNDND